MTTLLEESESIALQALSADIGVDVRHGFAQIDGLRLHYAEAGAGEPLILLHGWPQHWWEWRHVLGPLARKYRVICPDIRGLGWSEGSASGYTFQRLARDLIELMDHLELDRVRLVGRDWGLVAGYRAGLNWPDRFQQFVALAGVHPWTADGVRPPVFLRPWHVYLLALRGNSRHLQDRLTERSLHAWRYRGRFAPEEVAVYRQRMRTPAAYAATTDFNRNVVLHEVPHFLRHYRLLRLRVPTLHLNGAQDPLSEGIPHSCSDYADDLRFEAIPDCGHFVPEEQPGWLVERLTTFFG
ncbi:alpha/beta hydrolase [Nocardia terpenica]|uniref:alpha/beta fold hydrolase n=1 Tax=Nocardia terpenica TaxID=455432 RepID=UPI001893A065|nr:alpha/beta hydrolase [Nocardia terpenica]MBF6063906.1 alpha/beta hydrolase [Nocardia terpenica]MBF6107858.1 alpha/beta hydrolase [Nocardia terpenica]MBF6114926.1 alpha/beta hydrolase [Nocardia terpenica]MBF6121087.1 alpha/beta hydrolase [Nocardia terpenica]MBF6153371.1 alpha/beta hydrolase [Nocardia terpenica]